MMMVMYASICRGRLPADVSNFTFPRATTEAGVVCMQANVEVAVGEIIILL